MAGHPLSDRPTAQTRPPAPWLHRFTLLLAAATLLLITAGGMVTSTGSGLAVPDWPTTYGHNMFTFPYSKWVGGIFYEHGHRLIASTVGLLTIILAAWLQRHEPRRWLRTLGWFALAAVVFQGVLGGLTVIYLLPTPISVGHACLAQAFFCLVLLIASATSPGWRTRPVRIESSDRLPLTRWCLVLVGLVFGQLILGAMMRHTQSGVAVPDFPTAYGQWLPDLSPAAVERYNHHRRWDLWLEPVTVEQIRFHLAHRLGAVVLSVAMLLVCGLMLRRHGDVAALRRPSMLALLLLLAQWGLGAATVWSARQPWVATAHVAVGAATLGTVWVLALRARRLLAIRREQPVRTVALEGLPA